MYIVGAVALGIALFWFLEGRSMLRVGNRAPEFSAGSIGGERIQLSDFRGRKNVVLFFYPADFTRGCTEQVCSFRDNLLEMEKYDAVVMGVSHNALESHESFAAKYNVSYPLLSDPGRTIAKLYGAVWLGGLLPLTKRVSYVIDKQGVVRAVSHHEFDIEGHVEDVIEALKKCK